MPQPDESYPEAPPWPLDPSLEWNSFQEQWATVIPPPANLIAIYEMCLAAAITEQMRSTRHVRS
jgi:hypothetical protein